VRLARDPNNNTLGCLGASSVGQLRQLAPDEKEWPMGTNIRDFTGKDIDIATTSLSDDGSSILYTGYTPPPHLGARRPLCSFSPVQLPLPPKPRWHWRVGEPDFTYEP
jgi:hypothetical protein